MKKVILLFAALLMFSACTVVNKQASNEIPYNISPTGLKYHSIRDGNGTKPTLNQMVTIHFRMLLENGKVIEDTYLTRNPISFRIGSDEIILKGLEEAVLMMKTGGFMKLIIPPELGFGDRSVQKVPANSNLHIEVELLQIQN